MQNWHFQDGWDVYDSNNDKIGTVKQTFGDYFQIDTGFLGLGKDFYIPFSAIHDVRGEKVYITTTKDRLDKMGWDHKPSGSYGTSMGGGNEGRF